MLHKVISGAQTGADIAGLKVAKRFGLETGGTMPFGYKAHDGCHPKYKFLYGVTSDKSSSYVPRTRKNVKESDGTIRLAFDFESSGEVCTKKAIDDYKKPYIDVNLDDPCDVDQVLTWIGEHDIEVLNVAGNRERPPGAEHRATVFLEELFTRMGFKEMQGYETELDTSKSVDSLDGSLAQPHKE